ncbi:MAG: GWxTD domain-containing protein [Acidobacteria bacterium]|nr:GWxTD domain-containing protein [Acidobacteriota bacterium]
MSVGSLLEERTRFHRLTSNEDRDHFIESFWKRRDPIPGTPENELRENTAVV